MKKTLFFLVLLFAALIAVNGLFVVDETHTAFVLQFGEHKRTIYKAGLKWKIPLIQDVRYFDKRILEWDGEPTRVPTLDKKFIWVDTTARWKIKDPLQFFKTVRNEYGAQKKLDDIIDGITRTILSNESLIEIVRNSNRELVYSEEFAAQKREEGDISREKIDIKNGRKKIMQMIFQQSKKDAANLGIEIVDVLINRINYTEDVRKKVYTRMVSERRKVAERYRAEGQGERARILGRIEKEVKSIRSNSFRLAEEIKGDADAEAAGIYAKSYSQAPEFYKFVKALNNYKNIIDAKTSLIFTTQSDFLQFLKNTATSDDSLQPEAKKEQVEEPEVKKENVEEQAQHSQEKDKEQAPQQEE